MQQPLPLQEEALKLLLLKKMFFRAVLPLQVLFQIFLPLCDGNGSQVTFGIAEEFMNASIKYGPGLIPENWRNKKNASDENRYRLIFSPASFALSLDEMLIQEGVDVWFDTLICKAQIKNEKLSAIEVENKSGRGLVKGCCFVDATGDADLVFQARQNCPIEENAPTIWVVEYADNNKRIKELGQNCYIQTS